jgi:3-hydroxy-D-aspartate aldolase
VDTRLLGPNAHLIGKPGSREQLGTPALVLDLDVFQANIDSMAKHARSHRYQLRPSVKIHKSVEVARRQLAAGAVGVCCATLSEAEKMVDGGIPNVMLFTSVVTQPKLDRLAILNSSGTGLIVVADSITTATLLAAAAKQSGRALEVLVDFEIGGGRTGIGDEARLLSLADYIANDPHLRFAGIHAYNGRHMTIPDYEARRSVLNEQIDPVRKIVQKFEAAGLPPRIVSGGGTGSHDIDADSGVYTELQVGSYVFMDKHYADVDLRRGEPRPFKSALSVLTTVISNAQDGFVVTDAGSKEIDGSQGPLSPGILRGAPMEAVYSIVGDDMGRIDARDTRSLAVGATVEVIPPYCYKTVMMYSVYHCVSSDVLVDIWPIDARASW